MNIKTLERLFKRPEPEKKVEVIIPLSQEEIEAVILRQALLDIAGQDFVDAILAGRVSYEEETLTVH